MCSFHWESSSPLPISQLLLLSIWAEWLGLSQKMWVKCSLSLQAWARPISYSCPSLSSSFCKCFQRPHERCCYNTLAPPSTWDTWWYIDKVCGDSHGHVSQSKKWFTLKVSAVFCSRGEAWVPISGVPGRNDSLQHSTLGDPNGQKITGYGGFQIPTWLTLSTLL